MTITYGILSDLHGIDIRAVEPTIQILKKEGIEALVLNGAIFGERSGINPQQYLGMVLQIAGKSNLETYVLSGSHEEFNLFDPVINSLSSRYGNLINVFRNPCIDKDDHHLIFLPGSDWRAGDAVQHGYSLEDQNETGVYNNQGGHIMVINMNDLKKMVSDPEKTILFSHVPRKFDNSETGVDMAEFWETQQTFRIGDHVCEIGSIFPGPVGYQLLEQGAPIILKRENRGNETLRAIYEQLGITKNITGHFHESAGRACDSNGQTVEEGLFVPSLFYNASCMDRLMAGMLSVDGARVAYENVDLKKYFR